MDLRREDSLDDRGWLLFAGDLMEEMLAGVSAPYRVELVETVCRHDDFEPEAWEDDLWGDHEPYGEETVYDSRHREGYDLEELGDRLLLKMGDSWMTATPREIEFLEEDDLADMRMPLDSAAELLAWATRWPATAYDLEGNATVVAPPADKPTPPPITPMEHARAERREAEGAGTTLHAADRITAAPAEAEFWRHLGSLLRGLAGVEAITINPGMEHRALYELANLVAEDEGRPLAELTPFNLTAELLGPWLMANTAVGEVFASDMALAEVGRGW